MDDETNIRKTLAVCLEAEGRALEQRLADLQELLGRGRPEADFESSTTMQQAAKLGACHRISD